LKITVNLFATLSTYLPQDRKTTGRSVMLEVDENTTVRDITASLNVPEQAVKLIFVNGVHADMDTVLKDGDRLGMFPPVGGG
jgi:sulfur-carrier protein